MAFCWINSFYSYLYFSQFYTFSISHQVFNTHAKFFLDLTTELVYLTPELRADPCVAHALELRTAWALGNFHRFFKLYQNAPRMAAYLIDKFVERERNIALRAILKTWVQMPLLTKIMLLTAFEV